ncbi:hypothetical protein N7527_006439 [Penicillium freii]|nr:hypothetical protein N7527_006439 [Penicillium freii]
MTSSLQQFITRRLQRFEFEHLGISDGYGYHKRETILFVLIFPTLGLTWMRLTSPPTSAFRQALRTKSCKFPRIAKVFGDPAEGNYVMRAPCRSAILSHRLACDGRRSSPDSRRLIGVMTPGCDLHWRFAAIKHWPDAPPRHTSIPLHRLPMLIRAPSCMRWLVPSATRWSRAHI